jgi:phi13 family phage major tail protein
MTLGLKDLYYAVCTEKTDGKEEYGTPKKMAEAMTADLSVKTADGTLYADDTLSESVTEFASGTLKLGVKDLEPEVTAELLGQEVDGNKVVWAGKENEPPYVAVGFRAKKTGGRYRYVWLLKAKFKTPSEKYETKGESIKFNTPDIEADFTARKSDGLWKADFTGTESDTAAEKWFDAVPEKAEEIKEA